MCENGFQGTWVKNKVKCDWLSQFDNRLSQIDNRLSIWVYLRESSDSMGYLEQLEVALFGWQMKTLDKKNGLY